MIRLPPGYRDLIALSLPIAGIQFAQIALTTTDLMMMGLIGTEALAAGGLAMLLYNQFRTMCVGMVTGLGNLVAASIGRGERLADEGILDTKTLNEVRDLVRSALLLATLAGLVGGTVLAGLGNCLAFLRQDSAVLALATPAMIVLAPGLLPMVWLNVLRQFAVGMRQPGSLLRITVAAIAVNAFLNAVFIYGWGGMPALGLTGVALSTTLVQAWTFVAYLRVVRRDAHFKRFLSLAVWLARPSTVFRIARMGTPISLAYGLEAAVTSLASLLIGSFGPVALAASNVIHQLTRIVYQINVGLSHGSSIMVSRALARGRLVEVTVIARTAFVVCFVPMAGICVVYLLAPGLVLSPFLGSADADPAIFAAATSLLWYGAANQFLSGAQNIFIGLLRGLGNTASSLIITLVGYGLIGLPAVAICSFGLGWGADGVWLGMCIAFGATALLLWRQYLVDLGQVLSAGPMPCSAR